MKPSEESKAREERYAANLKRPMPMTARYAGRCPVCAGRWSVGSVIMVTAGANPLRTCLDCGLADWMGK